MDNELLSFFHETGGCLGAAAHSTFHLENGAGSRYHREKDETGSQSTGTKLMRILSGMMLAAALAVVGGCGKSEPMGSQPDPTPGTTNTPIDPAKGTPVVAA